MPKVIAIFLLIALIACSDTDNPDPVPSSNYRIYEFIHTRRTNETIPFEYVCSAENLLPWRSRRGGTFFSGNMIRYFYD